MSVHKRKNDTWEVKWRENGKQMTKNFGKGREGKRKAELFNAELLISKNKPGVFESTLMQKPIHFVDELGQAYLDDCRSREVSEKQRRGVASLLNKAVIPALGQFPLDQIMLGQVLDCVNQHFESCTLATRQRYLGYLRAMFYFGVRRGLLESNPLSGWKKTKEKPRQTILTLADLGKIHDHAPPHLAWTIEVLWNLGCRPGESELLSLRFEHIDWDNKTIQIYGRKTKTRRIIPLSPGFLERLREKMETSKSGFIIEYNGRPVRKFRRSWRAACKRAGITYDTVLYDIRHLFTSTLMMQGADLASVSRLLGHSSPAMTTGVYLHVMPGAVTETISKLPQLPVKEAPLNGLEDSPQEYDRLSGRFSGSQKGSPELSVTM